MKQKQRVKRRQRRRRTTARRRPQPLPQKTTPSPSLSLANIISSFYTFRSSVQDLSASLQRIENILDSCYRIFELAQTFVDRKPAAARSPLQLLPPGIRTPKKNRPLPFFQDNPQDNAETPSLGPLLANLDLQKMMELLQSPLVQSLLSGMLQGNNQNSSLKRKSG